MEALNPAAGGGTALCLSGGGYRAVGFHAGVLWRLNELGLMQGLGRISAVSGGAVLAGCLAMAWPAFKFEQNVAGNFVASNFREALILPVRRLLSVDIGTPATLVGLLPGRTGYGELARYLQAYAYGGRLMGAPAGPAGPEMVLCATDLRHGTPWTFDRRQMGNLDMGYFDTATVTWAAAVAASAGFVPLFSPARLDLLAHRRISDGAAGQRYRTALLADGGVYDDLALDPVSDGFGTVLISDASEELPVRARPAANWVCQLSRVREIAMSQVRLRRLAQARAWFARSAPAGAVFGLTAKWPDGADKPPGLDLEAAGRLARLPTAFVRMDARTQRVLINWGYAICAATLPGDSMRLPYPNEEREEQEVHLRKM